MAFVVHSSQNKLYKLKKVKLSTEKLKNQESNLCFPFSV